MASFDKQAALDAGYSPEEIDAFVQNEPSLQTFGQGNMRSNDLLTEKAPASGVVNFLAHPVIEAFRNVAGLGFEGTRKAASALGDKNAYGNAQTGKILENPFLPTSTVEGFANKEGNPDIGNAAGFGLQTGVDVGSALSEAELAARLPSIIKGIPGAIKAVPGFVKNPLNTIRTNMLSGAPVDTTEFETKTLQQLYDSPFYKNAPAATQQEARIGLDKILGNINPSVTGGETAGGEITKPAQMLLNKVYENLGPFEKMSKAYARGGDLPSTATAQGANLASHAVRQVTKDMSPWKAKLVTDLMHKSMTVAGNWKPILTALGVGEGLFTLHNFLSPKN